MTTYKQNNYNGELSSVSKFDDGLFICCIPLDEANTDYQQYLAWLAEGNEPLPADEVNE